MYQALYIIQRTIFMKWQALFPSAWFKLFQIRLSAIVVVGGFDGSHQVINWYPITRWIQDSPKR